MKRNCIYFLGWGLALSLTGCSYVGTLLTDAPIREVDYAGEAVNNGTPGTLRMRMTMSLTRVSGLLSFGGRICGGGRFTGTRSGYNLRFRMASQVPDCSREDGQVYVFEGTMERGYREIVGRYEVPGTTQQGTFRVVMTAERSLAPEPSGGSTATKTEKSVAAAAPKVAPVAPTPEPTSLASPVEHRVEVSPNTATIIFPLEDSYTFETTIRNQAVFSFDVEPDGVNETVATTAYISGGACFGLYSAETGGECIEVLLPRHFLLGERLSLWHRDSDGGASMAKADVGAVSLGVGQHSLAMRITDDAALQRLFRSRPRTAMLTLRIAGRPNRGVRVPVRYVQ